MSYNKSPLAFEDLRELFERALNSPKGVRVICANRGEAVSRRVRLNYFRKLNRAENQDIYDKDHPMHGKSVYDKLILRIPRKGDPHENVLFIEPRSIEDFQIEDIT